MIFEQLQQYRPFLSSSLIRANITSPASQVSFWAGRLASGEPIASVVAGMAASDAFAQQVALYGLGA